MRDRALAQGIGACGNYHTPRDAQRNPIADKLLAGGNLFKTERFTACAPNITPDPETGTGHCTEAQIIRAIREGMRPDGVRAKPPMAFHDYKNISADEMRAIVAYLRSLKPVAFGGM